MTRIFAVEVEIRKGLGAESAIKIVDVGLDDIEPDISEVELQEMVKREVDSQLFTSDDYPLYGKHWQIRLTQEV